MSKTKKLALSKAEGVVPELRFPEFENDGEWEAKDFSSYIKLYRGSSPRPIQEYLTQHESGINWIKIGDTKYAVNSIIYKVEEKITPKGAEHSRKVRIGELILANSMSFGKTYELAIDGCIYDGWFVLREYEKQFFKPFLLQLLNSNYMQNQYERLSAGGIVQNISSEIVYRTILLNTSFKEQQKIASCLYSLDEVIAEHTQKLEALKEQKKGLMQNLFPQEGETVPKWRFKEFEEDGEWVEKELSDLCFNISSGKDKNSEYGNFALYGSTGIVGKTDSASYTGDYILVARVGANAGLLNRAKGTFGVTDNTLVLDLKKTDLTDFIQYNLEKIGLNKLVFGSGQPLITGGQLKSLLLLTPKSDTEQKKIASCLSSIDILITAQSEKIEQLKLHKKGLMQGLFPKIV
jgi:type I restriction enzyme S subunit